MANKVVLLLICLQLKNIYAEPSGCMISFDPGSRPSDPRLLSGYNTILGPTVNLSYFDPALILSAKKLYPGLLRHPGGTGSSYTNQSIHLDILIPKLLIQYITAANYWSFKNASYVQPCSTSHYNYCKQQSIVESQPPQTFSPANFSAGVASAALLTQLEAHSVVYDLNLLTLNGSQLLDELNVLSNQLGDDNIEYLELGNEYSLSQQYKWAFPNASVYMKKALPLIEQGNKIICTCFQTLFTKISHCIKLQLVYSFLMQE